MGSNREYDREYQKRRRSGPRREQILAADRKRNSSPGRLAWRRERYRKNREDVLADRKAKYWANREDALAKNREWRKNNPHAIKHHILGKTYGLTLERFEEMRAAQGGACAICADLFTKMPHVDHDHSTGEVRELLCGGCNVGLGRFRDNPERMEAAAAYIRKHKAVKLAVVKDA